jgi:hypothetical protein
MLVKAAIALAGISGVAPWVIDVDGVPVVGYTAPALLGMFVLMLMRGDIVSRKVHEDMKSDRDYWRSAHANSEAARLTSSKQVDVLVEGFRTVDVIATAIHSLAKED